MTIREDLFAHRARKMRQRSGARLHSQQSEPGRLTAFARLLDERRGPVRLEVVPARESFSIY